MPHQDGNLYRNEWTDPCSSPLLGWNLSGGSGAPIPMPLPATTWNRLVVRSQDDRIEGFTTGVLATGSRRFFADPLNPAPTDNTVELHLSGTTIATPTCAESGQSGNTMGIPTFRKGAALTRPAAHGVSLREEPAPEIRPWGFWIEVDGSRVWTDDAMVG